MNKLTITYGEQILCDADVAEFQFSESADGVSVVGKFPKPSRAVRPGKAGGGGFAGLISAAAQQAARKDQVAVTDNSEGVVDVAG